MSADIVPVDGPLRGYLLKKGVKGPAKGWKRRWFQQVGNEICYYVNKDDNASKMGSICLDDVISVHPTSSEKRKDGKAGFRLNTPQRIYNLLAEDEKIMTYWVSGLVNILKEQTRKKAGGPDGSELQKRVDDLCKHNDRLQRALELACQKAGVTVSSIMAQLDAGASSASSAAGSTSATSSPASPAAAGADAQPAAAGAASEAKPDAGAQPPAFQSFQAKVLYDFTATRNEQLSLTVGSVLTVEGKHEGGWWSGVDPQGRRGFFPGSYVRALSDAPA